MSAPFKLGPAAFDEQCTPYRLLELAAALYAHGDLEDSERIDELAADLATIQGLPERSKQHA